MNNPIVPDKVIGEVFTRWTVKEYRGVNHSGNKIFNCKCACGTEAIVVYTYLRLGRTRSCGCLQIDSVKKKRKYNTALNNMYLQYKHNAAKRQYTFTLERDNFFSLVKSNCFYCGQTPEQLTLYKTRDKIEQELVSGIDRVDNDIGYEAGNVVACCRTCNQAKHAMTYDNFINWINKVYTSLKSKGTL